MKTVVNVYKDNAFWIRDPPGVGDCLRGCFYLEEKARIASPAHSVVVRFNLDLAPASQYLDYSAVHFPADRETLASAPEYCDPNADGDVDTVIDEVLNSEKDPLLISTNRSWRGVDDIPTGPSINHVALIVNFTTAFDAIIRDKVAGVPKPFALLHIQDVNLEAAKYQPTKYRWWSWKSLAYSRRVKNFIDSIVGKQTPTGCRPAARSGPR
jgi:hypothetical protein